MINNKKVLLFLAAIFTFLVFCIFFIFNYTFLTIETSGEDSKTIYISDSSGNIQEQYDATASSKRILLKKSAYNVKVIDKDRSSTYVKNLRMLSFNKLSTDLKAQKKSVFLGKSNLKCSKTTANQTIYYSCNPSSLLAISTNESSDAPITTGENSLKSTSKGFIKAEINNASLRVSTLNNEGAPVAETVSIKDFGYTLSDSDLSASNNNDNFSIHSRTAYKLYIFKDSNDKNPIKIDTPQRDSKLSVKTIAGDSYTYLVSFNPDSHRDGDETSQQEINIYDNKTGSLVNQRSIPSDWSVDEVSEANGDNLIVVSSVGGTRSTYLYNGSSNSLRPLSIDSTSLQKVCWAGDNSFYYVSDYSKNIYTYSIDNEGSYLIYKGLSGNALVNNVSCNGNKINFTIYSDTRQDIDKNYHYTLTEDGFSGIRIESVLPQYFNTDTNSYQALEDKNGIKLIPYSPNPADLNNATNALKGLLKDNGVEGLEKTNIFL